MAAGWAPPAPNRQSSQLGHGTQCPTPAYERLRRERAEKVVAYSHQIGRSKTISNPVGVWIRDLVLPLALKRFAQPQGPRLDLHPPHRLERQGGLNAAQARASRRGGGRWKAPYADGEVAVALRK